MTDSISIEEARKTRGVNGQGQKESLDAAVVRLSALAPREYELCRKSEATGLGVRVGFLDQAVDKARKKNTKTAKEKAKSHGEEDFAAAAREIIECDEVLGLFAGDWRRVVAGEEKNGWLLYLGATSRLFDKTMHIAIKGPSGSGKSEIRSRVLDFFPPESVVAFTSLSEKALLYFDDPFEHKILSMGEAAGTDEQSFQDYLLRELMSEGRLSYPTAQKVGGEIVTVTIEKEGPVAFMVTTTKLKLHPENETRMMSIDVDDSDLQTRAVFNKIAEVEGLNAPTTTVDYGPWHAFQRWLEAGERRVVVPFAPALAGMIPPKAVRLRRDLGQVLRAIKAHALIHRDHRDRDEHGQIIADIENDYTAVRGLMHDLLAETAEVKIKDTVLETAEAVTALTQNLPLDEGVSAVAVAKELKLDRSRATRRLWDTENAGLVMNLESRKGRRGKYRPTNEVVETTQMLPSSDDLNAHASRWGPKRAQQRTNPQNGEEKQGFNGCAPLAQHNAQPFDFVADAQTVAHASATSNPMEQQANVEMVRCCAGTEGVDGVDTLGDLEERRAIQEFDGGVRPVEAEMPPILDFLRR